MADKAHRLTDEKLEEMEKRMSAIYSRAEKTVQKRVDDYAKSIDEKSAELLQAWSRMSRGSSRSTRKFSAKGAQHGKSYHWDQGGGGE